MTTRRNKGIAALDLVLPVAPHYRTDPQVLKDVEAMRTNAASRWAKDDYANNLSGFHNTNDNNLSKIASLARPKVEILRTNSPTLKRLLAARVKLEKYASTLPRSTSPGRQPTRSVRETPYPAVYERQVTTVAPSLPPPPPPPPAPVKPTKSQSSLDKGPLDKITYEKTWTRSGNMKQKCSLEIWLPKPSVDDDDGVNTSRMATPEKKPPPIPTIKSRRSSIVKITATTTVTNIEAKSIEDVSSKKTDAVVIPRVYHYADYIMDLPDERPRSSKSITTVKSDSAGSIKSLRRQYGRSQSRRLSVSTTQSEEILRFGTTEVPTSAKNLSVNTKTSSPSRETKVSIRPNSSSMINDLMQRYSLMKKNHQELTQAKLQLEKSSTDSKTYSPRTQRPPVPESTSIISSDHPTVSVRKLLIDSSPARSATTTDHSNINTKLLDRRSTPRKLTHMDLYPQSRLFTLANHQQHRKSSASIPIASALPNVAGKKNDDTYRMLQRSKTLDVVLDIPKNSIKIPSRFPVQPDTFSTNILQRTTNVEQTPSRVPKRSMITLRPEQQKQSTISVVQTSAQHYHNLTTASVPTNKVFVHLN